MTENYNQLIFEERKAARIRQKVLADEMEISQHSLVDIEKERSKIKVDHDFYCRAQMAMEKIKERRAQLGIKNDSK